MTSAGRMMRSYAEKSGKSRGAITADMDKAQEVSGRPDVIWAGRRTYDHIAGIRTYETLGAVLYEVRYVLAREAIDGRL